MGHVALAALPVVSVASPILHVQGALRSHWEIVAYLFRIYAALLNLCGKSDFMWKFQLGNELCHIVSCFMTLENVLGAL